MKEEKSATKAARTDADHAHLDGMGLEEEDAAMVVDRALTGLARARAKEALEVLVPDAVIKGLSEGHTVDRPGSAERCNFPCRN